MYSMIRQIAKNWIKRGKRETKTKKYIYKTNKENWEKGIGECRSKGRLVIISIRLIFFYKIYISQFQNALRILYL